MKRIKMKEGKSCAGPDGQFLEYREYDVDDDFADMLVKAGSADYVTVAVPPPAPPAPEEPEEPKPAPEPQPPRSKKFNPRKRK